MVGRILLAYDGSDPARAAAAHAADLAVHYGAQVVCLVVGETLASDFGARVPLGEPEEYHRLAAEARKLVAGAGAEATESVQWGEAADTILAAAAAEKADLIVIGHRGHSVLRQWLLGSVAKKVIDHAACSVLVVRMEETKV